MYEIICSKNTCGFRVHERYFEEKHRFTPGYCARCSSPVLFVLKGTDEVVLGAKMDSQGRISVPV